MKLHKYARLVFCMICLMAVMGGCSKNEDGKGNTSAVEQETENIAELEQDEDGMDESEQEIEGDIEDSEELIEESEEEAGDADMEQADAEVAEDAENVTDVTVTPEPTATPESTVTAAPTKAPEATAKPTAAPTQKPTEKPTATPKPTSTPKPTNTPAPTKAPTATPEPTKAPVKEEASVDSIYKAVKKAYGEYYMPVAVMDEMTITELYQVDASWYEEAIGEGPLMSTHVDVFLGFKAKAGYADKIKAALVSYRDYLINGSLQYPMNIEKVENATVYQNGDYVFFLMLGGYREDVEIADYNKLAIQTIDSVISGK